MGLEHWMLIMLWGTFVLQKGTPPSCLIISTRGQSASAFFLNNQTVKASPGPGRLVSSSYLAKTAIPAVAKVPATS